MSKYRNHLPQLDGDLFLTYVGMETDLIFNQGVNLPSFASYPLLESPQGRAQITSYLQAMIDLAQNAKTGVILETPTWVANRDRGAALGYSPETLKALNIDSVTLMLDARKAYGDVPTVISANLGPRADAYAPAEQMSAQDAEVYHSEQISVFAETDVDMLNGYTIAYPQEATGMVLAAKRFSMPIAISFTVETDGRLPTGCSLADAITSVDLATDSYASYFMINCAHPDHFAGTLSDDPWMARLKGIVANASRCSHAELDEAEALDAGDPAELGEQLAQIYKAFPNISILGGCCGTDMRHMISIANAAHSG